MNVLPVRISGATLSEVRQKLRSVELPQDASVVEEVLSDGSPITIYQSAETLELAFAAALVSIPTGAKILERKELIRPTESTYSLEAFTDQEAKVAATQSLQSDTRLLRIWLETAGSKGFAGLGRRPSVYKFKVARLARVSITLEQEASIALVVKGDQYKHPSLEKDLVQELKAEDEERVERAKQALLKLGYLICDSPDGLVRPKQVWVSECSFTQGEKWISWGWNNMESAGSYEQIPVWNQVKAYIGTRQDP